MALHDSALRRSIHSIIQYSVLIVAQVLVAAIMTMIANKFDVRYLGHVTILFWIVLSILFCSVSPVEIVARLFLAFLSFFVSVGVYSILLLLYKTSSWFTWKFDKDIGNQMRYQLAQLQCKMEAEGASHLKWTGNMLTTPMTSSATRSLWRLTVT